MSQMIELDLTQFERESNDFLKEQYPHAVAIGMRDTALGARDSVRERTKGIFKLHSDYIPNAILSTPYTSGQMKSAEKSFRSYGDIRGAVFLRRGTGKRSMQFMVPHEIGGKKSADGSVAIPAGDIENYSYRTGRGAVSKRWKPSTLLQEFNAQSGNIGGNISGNIITGKNKKIAFIKRSPKSGALQIVRRKTKDPKSLQYLYTFKRDVNIKATWDFKETVEISVTRNYRKHFESSINAIL